MASTVFPRDFYVPKDRPVRVRVYEDVPATIVTYDSNGAPVALGWKGKAQKPTFHVRFRDAARAEQYVATMLERWRSWNASRAEARKARQKPHSLRVGQVLRSSWGYDQTNVDYYEVTRVVGPRTVEIREIGQVAVGERGGPSERVAPAVGRYLGEPKIKRASSDNVVRIASYAHAYPYDGQPAHQTGFGWGH